MGRTRVSDFFYYEFKSKIKKKMFFFFFWGGGTRVSGLFLQRIFFEGGGGQGGGSWGLKEVKFFNKESKTYLKNARFFGGAEGEGEGVTRVSEYFLLEIQI